MVDKNIFSLRVLGFLICSLIGISFDCASASPFLCRKHLEKSFYVITGRAVAAEHIFKLARSALSKEGCSVKDKGPLVVYDESVALSLIEQEWSSVVTHIIKKIRHRRRVFGCQVPCPIKVILGGGIIDYNQDVLKAILAKKAIAPSLDFVFSALGDKRAILGAVTYAQNICDPLLSAKKRYAIGIDLGGTHVRVALVDAQSMQVVGDILKQKLFKRSVDVDAMADFSERMLKNQRLGSFSPSDQLRHAQLANALLTTIANLVKKAASGKDIAFVALSSAGDITDDGYCTRATFLPFSGIHVRKELEERVKHSVVIAHDIFCGALGEKTVGAGKNDAKFVFVALGTFIGVQLFDSETWDCKNI